MLSGATSARAAASRSNGARAAASRANGSKSNGPRTAEGKARASQNALKHGMCAKKHLLLTDDSRAQFAALEAALLDDLAPEGALQTLLAHRLIAAAWRLARADRLEFELFSAHDALDLGPGRALIRDGRDARVFPTLVRYRGAAQAEFFRTLKVLKDLQAEAARNDRASDDEIEVEERAGVLQVAQKRATLPTKVDSSGRDAAPNEPEGPPSGHQSDTFATGNEPEPSAHAHPARRASGHASDVMRMRGEGMVRPVLRGTKRGELGDRPGGPASATRGMCGSPGRPGGRHLPS